MSEFEKVTTGLGEECGVFGAYDMDGGQLVRKPVIGRNLKPCEPNDIFWANQLLLGTSFYAMLFTAIIRTALFFVI